MTVVTAQMNETRPTRNQFQAAMAVQKQDPIEIEQVRVIKCEHPLIVSLCEICGTQTNLVTVLEAATLIDSTPYAIYRRVEAGELHFRVSISGELFICLNSLLDDQLFQAQPLEPDHSC